MVELILSEAQLACLKAAVAIGSEESAVLGRGMPFGSKLISPELFAIECTRDRGPVAHGSPAVLPRCGPRDSCRDGSSRTETDSRKRQ
jgi:hypothetical protein